MTTYARNDWQARQQAHRERMSQLLGPHLQRRRHGKAHPVYDFLFRYYSFPPRSLLNWTPGADVRLEGPEPPSEKRGFLYDEGSWVLPAIDFPEQRRAALCWTERLLKLTEARAPLFACYGLHEWAMVYRSAGDRRHESVPLRLADKEIARTVENLPLLCTHFDAFRFFTPEAVPRNRWQLERDTQPEFDQPGCIHANMDLYKHAYKLHPYLPSELLADTFELALSAREIDMRASPYELSSFGYPAIPVETAEGRAEYSALQQSIANRAAPVRKQLICLVDHLIQVLHGV